MSQLVFSAAISLLVFLASAAAQQRQPIRVGSNVQQSKLVHRVEPVYPDDAKVARVSGEVVLQTAVSESGEVTDVKVLKGDPLLDNAAADAVKQWRYSPTYLNGQPIAVIASVMVLFSLTPPVNLSMDESGNLKERSSGLQGEALLQKVQETQATVFVSVSAQVPFLTIEETLRVLKQAGAGEIHVTGGFVNWQGRLYYTHPLPDQQAPELALDNERLRALARNSRALDVFQGAPYEKRALLYQLFVNEVGEIVSIRRLRGPHFPELEAELARTLVIAPGRRGAETVPVAVTVEVSLE